jgi:hypothetical protein
MYSLLISFLPIILLGTFAYVVSTTSILDKVTMSNQQLLAQTEISIEQNLKVIDRSITQFTGLPIIRKVANIPLHEREFQNIREIKQYMEYTFTNEIGVESTYFLNLKQKWAIYPDKTFPLSSEQWEQYTALTKRLRMQPSVTLEQTKLPQPLITELGLKNGVLVIRSIPLYFLNADGLVIIKLSDETLHQWIADSENQGTLYILDDQMNIIASNARQSSLTLPPDMMHFTTEDPYKMVTFGSRSVYLFHKKSSYTNWTYVSMVPEEVIQKESHWIGWVTLGYGAMIVLIMLLLSYTGSLKIYVPIKKLFQTVGYKKVTSRNIDEITFIDQAFKNMNLQIALQGKDLTKYYVLQLLQSGMTQKQIQEVMSRSFTTLRSSDKFAVVAIQFDT